MRGIVDRNYDYTLDPSKKFQDYGLEEQGDVARDYYLVREGGSCTGGRSYKLSDFATVLPFSP